MTKHENAQSSVADYQSSSRLQAWAVGGCSAVVVVETATDMWNGAAHEIIFGVVLTVALLLLSLAMLRRKAEIFFEALVVLSACAWIAAGIAAHGSEGLVWVYSTVAALILISPSRYSEAFAVAVVICAALALWILQYRGAAADALLFIVIFTALMKLYKFSMNRQREAADSTRVRLELLLQCSDAGCFEWNGLNRKAQYSPRLREMLGFPAGADADQLDFLSHLPPGFKNRVKAAFFRQIYSVMAPYEVTQLPSMEYPLIRADKSRIWVQTRAIRISDRYGTMARYVCTFVDITARVEVERHLRAVNAGVEAKARETLRRHAELEKTLSVREEVERISRHDLKTPLGQIASLTDSLRSVRRPTAEEEAVLVTLEATARRAMRMLRLAIDFYPLEEGRFEFTPEPVDMIDTVRRVRDNFLAQADSKRVRFAMYPEHGELWAQADLVLCETMLENLLKNAVEAAPEGSTVTIRFSDGAKVRISIHNEGVVPPEVRETFFQKYATAGKRGGTGLGTYSAQLMARAQAGELRMTTCESQGTCLVLELMPVLESLDLPAPPYKSPLQPSRASRSVLIVDDDGYSAIALSRMVDAHGTARTAVNGHAAVDAVKLQRPDIIFMDLEMPVMGGMEAVGMIRAFQQQVGQQPSTIVAMSASDDAQTRRGCLAAGFDRCLIKPLSKKSVAEVLGRVEACAKPSLRHSVSNDFSMASSQG